MSIMSSNLRLPPNSWVKVFWDGSHEVGTDQMIDQGHASWTRGELEEIDHVLISNEIDQMLVLVNGHYPHQFDMYEARVGGPAQRVARVVQVQQENDLWTSHVLYSAGRREIIKDCKKGKIG